MDDSKTLALKAIADMPTDGEHDWHAMLVLAVTIARVELAPDFEAMLAATEEAITNV